MKNFRKAAAGIGILVLAFVLLGFTACSNPSGGGSSRTPVKDGTYVATGIGKSVTTPITVATTFANNTLVDISIGTNEETGPILDSVKSLMVPRIIQAQSIGVDSIAGATFSSAGVKSAIAETIDEAGGDSTEWYNTPPKSSKVVRLAGYDVIVVGLGGAGMAAYAKAAEGGGKVYGIEAAGKIGGNSATAGGPMSVNSQYIKDLYYGGVDYADRNALLKAWYADMQAAVPPNEIPYAPSVPDITTTILPYEGGPKWELIKLLIDESGETVSWLAQDYSFHFASPTYFFGITYGSDEWDINAPIFPGYSTDDYDDLFKTTMFTRAIERAKARNPESTYKLELRATDLIMADGKVAGVKATYRDGTTYEIYGKTVILATGGFIGDYDMKMRYYGANLKTEAVDTDRGDGIRMALAQGAGTYNIDMPGEVHIAQIKNIIQGPVLTNDQKVVLTNLLFRADGLVVGLHNTSLYNLAGKRFSNESLGTGGMLGGIALDNWMVGGYFASIVSNDVLASIKTSGMKFSSDAGTPDWALKMFLRQGVYTPDTPVPALDTILSIGEDYGNVVRASTLAELAEKLGISGEVLAATVAEYNTSVDTTTDGSFGKNAAYLTTKVTADPVAAGGYTAILGAGYYYGSSGGLDVDEDMQVLNTSRQKIPGLYATGQDSMGVLLNQKKAYRGGTAQAWAITSGRLAGAAAAAEAALP